MSFPPPWLWATQKGFTANVWVVWVAVLCLNSFQPLVETVPVLEHEGGTPRAVQPSGHQRQPLWPWIPLWQSCSLTGPDQSWWMRPCLMHVAQERHFPGPNPTANPFLPLKEEGKKVFAKNTRRWNWGTELAFSEPGHFLFQPGRPCAMHICNLNHFQPHSATDIRGIVLLSDLGNWGFQRSNKLLEVTKQTQYLKPDLLTWKLYPFLCPWRIYMYLQYNFVICKRSPYLASYHTKLIHPFFAAQLEYSL